MHLHSSLSILCGLLLGVAAANDTSDTSNYQPCPLLRAYYPVPTISSSSASVQSAVAQLSGLFDDLIATGSSDYFGSITPNSTSFSLVLFTGESAGVVAEEEDAKNIIFSYQHTARDAASAGYDNVTVDTVFPAGTLTQLFTVYTWLVQVGDGQWDAPITDFLPELVRSDTRSPLAVHWEDVTIGALAGQMSGLVRDSHACKLGQPCDYQEFVKVFADTVPYFLPDTTPVISNAAYQLLAFALERAANNGSSSFADILSDSLFSPLNMTTSSLISPESENSVFGQALNSSATGEPAALSLLTTTRDLARAGHAMLASTQLSAAATRRWLQPVADTSNLRNGVGRPWEIYHAGEQANSSVLDIYTKSGATEVGTTDGGAYASYFGLVPDLGAGFAILAHDTSGAVPDLNAYVDVISLALSSLQDLAAAEAATQYAGTFSSSSSSSRASFNVTDGYGLVASQLTVDGVDLRNEAAAAASIALDNLDLRLYPSNVIAAQDGDHGNSLHLFVAVFQDKSAPADMGTPTCITWQNVGSLGADIFDRVVFAINGSTGRAESVSVLGKSETLARQA